MRIIQPLVAAMEKGISRWNLLANIYCYYYQEAVKKEIELASIGPADLVFNIGGGAVPFTAINIARLTGARVLVLDRDSTAVKLARCCVGKLGLGEKIRVELGDGAHYLPSDYTVAVIALQVEPKGRILQKVMNCKGNKRIVVRSPSQLFKNHYDGIPSEFKADAYVGQNMKTFRTSLLMYTGNA